MRSWGLAGWLLAALAASLVLSDASSAAAQGEIPRATARLGARIHGALSEYRALAKLAGDDEGCDRATTDGDVDPGSACKPRLDEEQRELAQLKRAMTRLQTAGRVDGRAVEVVERVSQAEALEKLDPDDEVEVVPARDRDDDDEAPDLEGARELLEQARIRD